MRTGYIHWAHLMRNHLKDNKDSYDCRNLGTDLSWTAPN